MGKFFQKGSSTTLMCKAEVSTTTARWPNLVRHNILPKEELIYLWKTCWFGRM